jgi:hypothetical protein
MPLTTHVNLGSGKKWEVKRKLTTAGFHEMDKTEVRPPMNKGNIL